ncbi:hypothetical protein BGX33_001448 [Mortierella sp. NVP41]|nr:hypothetical protein BGX33_001448 [Mortierella sp. NVP41]
MDPAAAGSNRPQGSGSSHGVPHGVAVHPPPVSRSIRPGGSRSGTNYTSPWMTSARIHRRNSTTQTGAHAVTEEFNPISTIETPTLRHLTSISRHIAIQGLVHGAGSDIALRAFHKTYRLHRLILTQATFFENMLQGPWKESDTDTVDMTFDDPNITQEGFDIAIGRLYGVWTVECEDDDVNGYQNDMAQAGYPTETEGMGSFSVGGGQALGSATLTPRNVFSVLAVAAYLGIDPLCDQCTSFAARTLRTDNLLAYIQFSGQSGYYPWSDKISETCHAYLCRNGLEDPKMRCFQVFEQLPLDWLLKVIGSDAFWVPTEWDRYKFCRKVVHRRRAIASITRSLSSEIGENPTAQRQGGQGGDTEENGIGGVDLEYDDKQDEDDHEAAYEVLFSSCIIYMHMTLEQLQCIQRDVDPATGFPFVRSAIILQALWHQIELRNLIETHDPNDTNSNGSNGGGGTLGITASEPLPEFDGPDWIRKPFALYKPIPEKDTTQIGDHYDPTLPEIPPWTYPRRPAAATMSTTRVASATAVPSPDGSAGSQDATSFWSHFFPRSQPRHSTLHPFQLKNLQAQGIWNQVAGNAGLGHGGLGIDADIEKASPGQYSLYAPFRFSVAFTDVQSLRENVRVCTDTFFYAGSYWNVYIQKLPASNQKGVQLGAYLHRHSVPQEPGSRKKPGLPLFPPPLTSHHNQRGDNRSHGQSTAQPPHPSHHHHLDGRPDSNHASSLSTTEDVQYIDLPTLQPLEDQLYRRSMSSTAMPGGLDHCATPAEDSFSCFVDQREKTKTWFKIFAVALGPSHVITQFQSSPDDFSVMQSWGWRSATLCSDDYLPETPVPMDDLAIKLQTACYCTGIEISPGFSETGTATTTLMTEQLQPQPQLRPQKERQRGKRGASGAMGSSSSILETPLRPAAVATATTATTTVTDTGMDLDYVYEYEYDEEQQQQQQQKDQDCGVGSQVAEEVSSVREGAPVHDDQDHEHQDDSVRDDLIYGHDGGARIFIRSPLLDTRATDPNTTEAATYPGCDCEAQSRYRSGHHHHSLQPLTLKFSIVMGHV